MTTSDIFIEAARPDELPIVLSLLDDAAGWLRERGIDQWPESFSRDTTWRIDRLRFYIEQGLTYLARDESGPAATFTLSRAADPQFAHGWSDGSGSGGYSTYSEWRSPDERQGTTSESCSIGQPLRLRGGGTPGCGWMYTGRIKSSANTTNGTDLSRLPR